MSDPDQDALNRATESVEDIINRAEESAQREDDHVELPVPEPEKPLDFGA